MMSTVNKRSPLPLYYQVAESIRQKIAQSIYQRGQLIPTEIQLQEEYGVSRETVRKAINDLVIEGLVKKVHGKGTFVSDLKIVHRISSIYGSSDEIIARGMTPSTDFLEKKEIDPPAKMREEMGLNKSDKVSKISRLRFADGTPVAILTSYLPSNLVPDIIHTRFVNGSLYSTLEKVYHLTLNEADEEIEASSAREDHARLLEIEPDSPILIVNRLTYLDDTRVIEKLVALYRSDAFKYKVRLKGRMPVLS